MVDKFDNGENPIRLDEDDFEDYAKIVDFMYDKVNAKNIDKVYTFRGIRVIQQ